MNAQAVLYTAQPLTNVTLDGDGSGLPAEALTKAFVRYVITDEFAGGCGHRSDPTKYDSLLVADMLNERWSMGVEACTWPTARYPRPRSGSSTSTCGRALLRGPLPQRAVVEPRALRSDATYHEPAGRRRTESDHHRDATPLERADEGPFGSMMMRIRRPDGSWSYDYAVFDRWVEFMMGLGIDGLINCYTMVP